jgi:hypothetical protein
MTFFWIFKKIHPNIIILRKLLGITQWFKGAHAAPNRVVRPLVNFKCILGEWAK